jgi:UDP-2,3-diacylglucosamine hydrolase
MSTVPQAAELIAPPAWRTVDFISDLHLQASDLATFGVWQRYLASSSADALFILGDLFEVWVGDDVVLDATGKFEAECADLLRAVAQRMPVFFMHGNRDFLVGADMLARCGASLLEDPSVLEFGGVRLLLSHGDALCTGDTAYMAFRSQVRSPRWQADFLGQPLLERQAIAHSLRQQSEARKSTAQIWVDVDTATASTWLRAADSRTLLHGHTHKPAAHDLGGGLQRVVLSDWDALAQVPRAEVLRLRGAGSERITLV